MVVDMNEAEERAYLDKLAAAMQLDPELVKQLEAPLTA